MKKNLLIVLIVSFNVFSAFAQAGRQISNENIILDYPSLTVTNTLNPSPENLFLGPTSFGVGHLLILNVDMVPIFYKKITEGIVYDFKLQSNGKLTYNISTTPTRMYGLNIKGVVDEEYITPPGYDLDVHDLQVLDNGTYYVIGRDYIIVDMSQYVLNGDTAATLITNTIHHMDVNDNEIWRWNSIDHYNILDVDEFVDLTNHVIDWTHCNSVDIDSDGNIVISTRNFNEITKISRITGEIIWRFGGDKNQFQIFNDNRGFSRQHDVRVLSNGNIALFDNGQYLIPSYSSYVEYDLDELNHTATLIRRYSRDGSIHSEKKGGIFELPNGNISISWDGVANPFVSEINHEDSTVFEVRYDDPISQYRAYRFSWRPNLFSTQYDSLDFGIVAVGNSSRLNLKLFNPRDDTVLINETYIQDSSFYVDEILPFQIAPYDSIEITIVFLPLEEGSFTDKINFRYVTDTLLIAQQIFVKGTTSPVFVENYHSQSFQFSLSQNYPNPFNPLTTISWQSAANGNVTIKVYDMVGQNVATLVDEYRCAGNYKTEFNAINLPSGVYFYQMRIGEFVSTKKMILLK